MYLFSFLQEQELLQEIQCVGLSIKNQVHQPGFQTVKEHSC